MLWFWDYILTAPAVQYLYLVCGRKVCLSTPLPKREPLSALPGCFAKVLVLKNRQTHNSCHKYIGLKLYGQWAFMRSAVWWEDREGCARQVGRPKVLTTPTWPRWAFSMPSLVLVSPAFGMTTVLAGNERELEIRTMAFVVLQSNDRVCCHRDAKQKHSEGLHWPDMNSP
jgi:hypothetical protein